MKSYKFTRTINIRINESSFLHLLALFPSIVLKIANKM